MPYIDESAISCGVEQLYNLTSPHDAVIVVQNNLDWFEDEEGESPFAFLVFSDTVRRGRGSALAKYIKSRGLGTVNASRPKKNPQTGNMIQVWIWSVNWAKIKAFK